MFSRFTPPKPSIVFDTYWRFAAERQSIFFRRIEGMEPPWTEDQILGQYKFTNVYRASDRVSQYLIRNVIYKGDQSPEEIFFRVLLFKLFNRIDTWRLLEGELDTIRHSEFDFVRYDRILSNALERGQRLYSAAYIMPTAAQLGHSRKHRNHLMLLARMMQDGIPIRVCQAKSMRQVYQTLISYPSIGRFLAYQFTIDLNYSVMTDFSELDFVVPGPGALDGIRKCFASAGDLSEESVIHFMADRQREEFDRLGLNFRDLWGRPLQLIDCQNLFCEVDKYARLAHPKIRGISGRTRIKHKFTPSSECIDSWYPPKWGINASFSGRSSHIAFQRAQEKEPPIPR